MYEMTAKPMTGRPTYVTVLPAINWPPPLMIVAALLMSWCTVGLAPAIAVAKPMLSQPFWNVAGRVMFATFVEPSTLLFAKVATLAAQHRGGGGICAGGTSQISGGRFAAFFAVIHTIACCAQPFIDARPRPSRRTGLQFI